MAPRLFEVQQRVPRRNGVPASFLQLEPHATRCALIAILAVIVWWGFLVGQVMKSMKRTLHLNSASLALLVAFSLLSSPVRAGLNEGLAAYQAGNIPLAVKEFRACAEKGEAGCQFNVALMYERGIGVSKDEKEALAWYRKAALQGNSLAQFNLAVLYENGRGSDVDFAQAHRWYRKAAAQGDALAVGNLGMLYLRGQGVKEEKVAGLALLLLSVTMDNSPENHAKQSISKTKGLTPDVIAAAQTLSSEMGKAGNLLMALDRYLKNTPTNAADKPFRELSDKAQ